jgi:hypothetical protein
MGRRSPATGTAIRLGQVPSVRLVQVLRTYCHRLDPAGSADLRASLLAGRYPWLREEFAAAICRADPPATWWESAIGDPLAAPEARSVTGVREEQRRLWRSLFPGVTFPGRPAPRLPRR